MPEKVDVILFLSYRVAKIINLITDTFLQVSKTAEKLQSFFRQSLNTSLNCFMLYFNWFTRFCIQFRFECELHLLLHLQFEIMRMRPVFHLCLYAASVEKALCCWKWFRSWFTSCNDYYMYLLLFSFCSISITRCHTLSQLLNDFLSIKGWYLLCWVSRGWDIVLSDAVFSVTHTVFLLYC